MEIPSDEELETQSKPELILLIKTIYNKFLEKPKTSEAQLKAMRNYYNKNPEAISKMRKQYYDRIKQDSNWVEEKNRIRREKYNQKKLLTQNSI